MKGNQNANMSREEFNNVQAKQVANTAYNGNELYDKGIVRGKIFVLPEEMRNERVEITLNEGYIFKDENGNIINATKIVLEKKKNEYPKTYEECYKILNMSRDYTCHNNVGYKWELITNLQKLLICRDAYWKIAGEEMGLGKPWEPDWTNEEWPDMAYISYDGKSIDKENGFPCCNMILIFPTEDMRDAFYENFKELIEFCKELL